MINKIFSLFGSKDAPCVKIYRIYYRDEQIKNSAGPFIPYDNSSPKYPGEFEYGAFKSLYESGALDSAEISGTVSWKFEMKTRIKARVFVDEIRKNPGYDVYFATPWPELGYLHKNVWTHGELFHPGLNAITGKLFALAGYDPDILKCIRNRESSAFCNYWAGTKQFREKYHSFTKKIYDAIEKLDSADRNLLFNVKADRQIEAPFFPFIFERLFSTLLEMDKEIKYYPLPMFRLKPKRKSREPLKVINEFLPGIEAVGGESLDSLGEFYFDLATRSFSFDKEYAFYKHFDKNRIEKFVRKNFKENRFAM